MYSGYHGYISLSLLSSNMSNSYYYLGNRDMIMRDHLHCGLENVLNDSKIA